MEDGKLLNNRYQLKDTLGTGGMAVVYLAYDLTLERSVAIKVLRQDYSKDADFRELFHQEAKAAANLSHPNIVTVHDFGLDAGQLFIVMEHVPGTDLKTMIKKQGKFSVNQAIALIIQACAGVGYAHRAGLVHCDIKPQNMLITPDMRLKVVDFGIARALATIHPDEKTDVIWGSPQYFSPEQASGEPPTPASDVYSLGVVLYEMLTSKLPFIANSAEELARLHRDALPKRPRQLNPAIPPELDQILLKVLLKEPAARYRTADQMGRVLVTFSQQSTTVSAVTPPKSFETSETGTSAAPLLNQSRPLPVETSIKKENPLDIDWLTVLLGLLALIAVGGLIPFWLWIYFLFNPPLR